MRARILERRTGTNVEDTMRLLSQRCRMQLAIQQTQPDLVGNIHAKHDIPLQFPSFLASTLWLWCPTGLAPSHPWASGSCRCRSRNGSAGRSRTRTCSHSTPARWSPWRSCNENTVRRPSSPSPLSPPRMGRGVYPDEA